MPWPSMPMSLICTTAPQSLKHSGELAEARVQGLTRQLADAAKQLDQAAADNADLKAELATAQNSKPAVVELSQVRTASPSAELALRAACLQSIPITAAACLLECA